MCETEKESIKRAPTSTDYKRYDDDDGDEFEYNVIMKTHGTHKSKREKESAERTYRQKYYIFL